MTTALARLEDTPQRARWALMQRMPVDVATFLYWPRFTPLSADDPFRPIDEWLERVNGDMFTACGVPESVLTGGGGA